MGGWLGYPIWQAATLSKPFFFLPVVQEEVAKGQGGRWWGANSVDQLNIFIERKVATIIFKGGKCFLSPRASLEKMGPWSGCRLEQSSLV